MSVHTSTRWVAKPSLLDVAAEVLVADPAASLADVAEAAGIGRTTLHKNYATRDDLMRAVAHRAIDRWEHAVDTVTDGPDGGLRALAEATIPIGPQLSFLWRSPILDHVPDIIERWTAVERRGLAVLQRARTTGAISSDVPDWWLLQTFYSLVYVASEAVRSGHLAPRDAPDLVIRTLLRGIGGASDQPATGVAGGNQSATGSGGGDHPATGSAGDQPATGSAGVESRN